MLVCWLKCLLTCLLGRMLHCALRSVLHASARGPAARWLSCQCGPRMMADGTRTWSILPATRARRLPRLHATIVYICLHYIASSDAANGKSAASSLTSID